MSDTSETEFHYAVGEKHYCGLLLRILGGQAKAAMVLLPDWRGQSALARDHAGHLLALGCVVSIADLYGDGFNPESPDQVGPMVRQLMDNRDQGVAALAACVERLRQEVPAGTPVLCLGYSAGGMVALDYGRSGADVAGIILCSALLKTAAEGMDTRIRAPVLILQGTQDQVSPMESIAALVTEMDVAGNDVRFNLYSQTHHAFDNPEAGTDPNARLVYSPTSARRAKEAIASFLAEVTKH
ncbi:dienelactone hydrolase family protein [Rhizobium calliandrae]|uniref:Dienelactone hydrolase family protein n=1 Tax=Rhizobium calliandrae TaxID=1312182 RepID=A0ABT7KL48_9HYPH|nr:dienelactone hydrolase family protein [Rhizobium calliandrae]MDL2408857.1 dienelactone hydrolase family protein [Rhizobium calliandrae]